MKEKEQLVAKEAPSEQILDKYFKKVTNLTRSWGKRQALIFLLKEKILKAKLVEAQVRLEGDP